MKWEEPPATNRRAPDRQRIDKEVAMIKKNPGRWARVRQAASAGSYTTYKKRGLTTRTKHVGDNKYDIWACWEPDSEIAQEFLAKQAKKKAK